MDRHAIVSLIRCDFIQLGNSSITIPCVKDAFMSNTMKIIYLIKMKKIIR